LGATWRAAEAALPWRLAEKLSHGNWKPAPHLKRLSRLCVEAVMGRRPRVIVTMPPRHGKSLMASRWFPVWFLNAYPHKRMILASYGADFAAEHGRWVRNTVAQNQADLRVRLAPDSQACNRWDTPQGGGMVTAGVDGPITGRGADLLILDDAYENWQVANSSTVREHIWNWWLSTAYTRLEPGGAILIVMTRWHRDDIVGRLIREMNAGGEIWEVLKLPALAEDRDALGRRAGEALWPARYDIEALHRIRATVGDDVWLPLYQQEPPEMSGAGRVYHSFSRINVPDHQIPYYPGHPVVWAIDFNVDPMCAVVGQLIETTTYLEKRQRQRSAYINILDEICLPDSNTFEACEQFLRHFEEIVPRKAWNTSLPELHIYGDPSGTQRQGGGRTNWQIVKDFVSRHADKFRPVFKIRSVAPAVKDRVNAVNGLLQNALGQHRLFIDASCQELVKDFERVSWKRDADGNPTGQLSKSDPKRTHMTDALGYMVEREFSLTPRAADGIEYIA